MKKVIILLPLLLVACSHAPRVDPMIGEDDRLNDCMEERWSKDLKTRGLMKSLCMSRVNHSGKNCVISDVIDTIEWVDLGDGYLGIPEDVEHCFQGAGYSLYYNGFFYNDRNGTLNYRHYP